MAAGVTIVDKDYGYKALLERALGLAKDRPSIATGILAADGAKAYDDGQTVLDVGIDNEFGTKDADGSVHVPARSFVRAWFDAYRSVAHKKLAGLLRKVLARELTADQALEQFGLWAQGSMQKHLASGIAPPNAESTIRRKGSSTPLIATGQLRASISYEVRKT